MDDIYLTYDGHGRIHARMETITHPGALDALRAVLPAIDETADGEAISAFCALRDAVSALLDGDTPEDVRKAALYHLPREEEN